MPSQPNTPNTTSGPNQEVFDMFIMNGMDLVYDENQAKSMLQRIGASEDPTKAMAETLVDVIVRITSSAKQAGKNIPPEIVLHGGNFLFAEMLKVLEAAGMDPMTEEQKTAVWQMASSFYIDKAVQSGVMSKQELMALSEEVKQTEEGKKVIKTAENPESAMQKIDKPAVEDTVLPAAAEAGSPGPPASPAAMTMPTQGGM